jgi:hypothetical protein
LIKQDFEASSKRTEELIYEMAEAEVIFVPLEMSHSRLERNKILAK